MYSILNSHASFFPLFFTSMVSPLLYFVNLFFLNSIFKKLFRGKMESMFRKPTSYNSGLVKEK